METGVHDSHFYRTILARKDRDTLLNHTPNGLETPVKLFSYPSYGARNFVEMYWEAVSCVWRVFHLF